MCTALYREPAPSSRLLRRMSGLALKAFLLVVLQLALVGCSFLSSNREPLRGQPHSHHPGHHPGHHNDDHPIRRVKDILNISEPRPGFPLLLRPEHSGFFSVFVQLRVSYHLAKFHHRPLVIESTSNSHFGYEQPSACSWFQLPSTVRCAESWERSPCRAVDAFHYNMTHGPFCWEIYSFADHLGNSTTARAVAIKGAGLAEPPLLLTKPYQAKARAFLRRMNPSRKPYTVVHWRRGDQLVTRCAKHKDLSVNCASPRDFVDHVRSQTSDAIVYVATNEQNEDTLQYLHGRGLLTFSSVLPAHNESLPVVFAIEVWLMQFADRFQGWGVSEVNDVIESDRRQRGHSYCLGHRAADTNSSYYGVSTWCASIQATP